MFMLRQYAACLLVVSVLGATVLLAGAIGYLLKSVVPLVVRGTLVAFRRFRLNPVAASRAPLIFDGTEPSVIAEGPS
jgi:hypothetical protein